MRWRGSDRRRTSAAHLGSRIPHTGPLSPSQLHPISLRRLPTHQTPHPPSTHTPPNSPPALPLASSSPTHRARGLTVCGSPSAWSLARVWQYPTLLRHFCPILARLVLSTSRQGSGRAQSRRIREAQSRHTGSLGAALSDGESGRKQCAEQHRAERGCLAALCCRR